jgi:hypothetical protein
LLLGADLHSEFGDGSGSSNAIYCGGATPATSVTVNSVSAWKTDIVVFIVMLHLTVYGKYSHDIERYRTVRSTVPYRNEDKVTPGKCLKK